MKKYRLYITEEIGGYIVVEANNKEKAEEVAEELLDEYGCDRLFYPIPEDKEDLAKYNGNQKHGDRDVVGCEEMK
jgi:hypothetical protein